MRPRHSIELLIYLREEAHVARGRHPLAPASINRILAAISSFFDHLILSDAVAITINPLGTSHTGRDAGPRIRSGRRYARLRRVERLPRPLSEDQVTSLFLAMCSRRDVAIFLLMLQGGLRVGEVLNLRLGDIQYGRRRIAIRYATEHPKGVRTKSRSERIVDLHEPETLAAISAYVGHERPQGSSFDHLFLASARGPSRGEPIGYAALAKLFQRRKAAAGLTEPWITLHSLRHTHATRMWEGGMKELCLPKASWPRQL